jgi:hypothetical protein
MKTTTTRKSADHNHRRKKMQTDTDKLEYLSRRLTAWDQDLRWGHRGVEQLQMFLRQVTVQSQADRHGQGGEPDSSSNYSRDDLEFALCPETLATFRMMATEYLLKVPGLLAAIDRCEEMLRDVDGRGV